MSQLTLDQGRIRLADSLLVYPERTLAPPEPLPSGRPPTALGLAPVALSGGRVLAALGRGEALWLGFQALDPARPTTIRVRLDEPAPRDGLTGAAWRDELDEGNVLVCPPDHWLPSAFSGGDLTVLVYDPSPAEAAISLASLEEFTRATGRPAEPVDPDSGYKGWRLP